MIKILINVNSIEPNPQYGLDFIHVYLGKTEIKDSKGRVIDVKFNYATHNVLPQWNKYTFEYRRKKIQCTYCKAKFYHTELESDSDDDWEAYSNEICPKCGKWGCLGLEEDISYETIEELEIRTGKRIKG